MSTVNLMMRVLVIDRKHLRIQFSRSTSHLTRTELINLLLSRFTTTSLREVILQAERDKVSQKEIKGVASNLLP